MLGLSRLGGFTRSLFISILLIHLLVLCTACQPIGPTYRQDASSTDSRPWAPNRIGLANRTDEKDWNYQVESSASSSYTEIQSDGALTRATQGAPAREIFVQTPDGKRFTVASASDMEVSGVAYEQDGANRSTIRIDTFKTVTSEPQRAVNEALDRMYLAWNELTPAQKEAHIEAWENMTKLGDTLAPVLLTLFKAAAG